MRASALPPPLILCACLRASDSFFRPSPNLRPPPPRGRIAAVDGVGGGYRLRNLALTLQPDAGVAKEFLGIDIGEDLRGRQRRRRRPRAAKDDVDDDGILASLFGSACDRDRFFAESFGRRAAHLPRRRRAEDAGGFDERLAPPMAGIDMRSLYETNEWMTLRKEGSRDALDKFRMTFEDLKGYIARGGSVVVPVTPADYLHPVKARIERALGVEEEIGTSMNVYHSGPEAVALKVHYDAYPVLVLQLEGQKEWMLQNGAFGCPAHEVTTWKNLTMEEGDLLYIPMGVLHAATTSEGCNTTTHATIGLL